MDLRHSPKINARSGETSATVRDNSRDSTDLRASSQTGLSYSQYWREDPRHFPARVNPNPHELTDFRDARPTQERERERRYQPRDQPGYEPGYQPRYRPIVTAPLHQSSYTSVSAASRPSGPLFPYTPLPSAPNYLEKKPYRAVQTSSFISSHRDQQNSREHQQRLSQRGPDAHKKLSDKFDPELVPPIEVNPTPGKPDSPKPRRPVLFRPRTPPPSTQATPGHSTYSTCPSDR